MIEGNDTLSHADGDYTVAVVAVDGHSGSFPFESMPSLSSTWEPAPFGPLPSWTFHVDNTTNPRYVQLTDSSPDFVVYRAPMMTPGSPTDDPVVTTEANMTPEPPQPTATPDPSATPGDDEDGDSEDSQDDATIDNPTPLPEPTCAPDSYTPPAEPAVDSPVIKFGVRYAGWEGWTATVKVYDIAEGDGALSPTPLATKVKHSTDANPTQVTWDELFPNTKPASGVYAYNIQVAGVTETPSLVPHLEGLSGQGTEAQRLDTDTFVTDLQYNVIEEATPTPAPDTADAPPTPDASSVVKMNVKFRLTTANGTPLTASQMKQLQVWLVNPQLQAPDSWITLQEAEEPGETADDPKVKVESGVWSFDASVPHSGGPWMLVASGRSKHRGTTTPNTNGTTIINAKVIANTLPTVTGIATAIVAYDGSSAHSPSLAYSADHPASSAQYPNYAAKVAYYRSHDDRRFDTANAIRFYTFVQIKWQTAYDKKKLPHVQIKSEWYGSAKINFDPAKLHWISCDVWGSGSVTHTVPASCEDITKAPLLTSLGLNSDWKIFENAVVSQVPNGVDRWYGMHKIEPATKASTESHLSFKAVPTLGTYWFGVKVSWKALPSAYAATVGGNMVYLFPTDREGGNKLIRLSGGDEYHGGNKKSGDDRFNIVHVGGLGLSSSPNKPDGRMTQHLWLPDPRGIAGDTPEPWSGRVSGMEAHSRVTFDNDDDFFSDARAQTQNKQGDFNAEILRYAESYLNVPYAWGGSTYGGAQSRGSGDAWFTRGDPQYNLTDKVQVPSIDKSIPQTVGSADRGSSAWLRGSDGNTLNNILLDGRGYGIDCSGFISVVAAAAGLNVMKYASSHFGYHNLGATLIRRYPNESQTPAVAKEIAWGNFSPGDIAVEKGHIVYGTSATYSVGNQINFDTIEANPGFLAEGAVGINDAKNGRVRRYTRQVGAITSVRHFYPRRWIAP